VNGITSGEDLSKSRDSKSFSKTNKYGKEGVVNVSDHAWDTKIVINTRVCLIKFPINKDVLG
jgi:hypothetical protein